MQFSPTLVSARFVRRYKRFFVDATLPSGELVVAHCANTGALTGCLIEGAEVLLAPVDNPARTLRYAWKAVRIGESYVGVDTALAVPLVEEAIRTQLLPELAGYPRMLREVKYGREGTSRIDILLSRGGTQAETRGKKRVLPEGDERVYVEVKNTTLVEGQTALFPDAVTERGQKHLEELVHVVKQGQRAAMVYVVQREGCSDFRAAEHIDPRYAQLLRKALKRGVEVYAIHASHDATGVHARGRLTLALDGGLNSVQG
jgi:sugar fermentation stimulation protein A